MSTQTNPLTGLPPAEVSLPEAPLVRVIVQVRFPTILAIEKRELVAPFQEILRDRYPVLRVEQTRGILIGPEGPEAVAPSVVWRFADIGGNWRVSLATEFVAIETTAYECRGDLLDRLDQVIQALKHQFGPKTVDRLGVRYIDRITGDAIAHINEMVRPEILGITGTAMVEYADRALSEALFSIPETSAFIQARWGILPPNGTVDPAAMEPVDERSWILDLDIFNQEPGPFEPATILANASGFAERCYTFFRWVVTDDFLRRYGGEI